jgi:molybdopterin-containing oxidoreductase family membrane subunit
MTIQPMWHSTIFGPYFVVGAIFSGIASLIIAMAILRKALHLEEYLKPIHFNNLGILLLTMCLLWAYFTFAEYLTTFYGAEPEHMEVFYSKLGGEFTLLFIIMLMTCFVIPFIFLAISKLRTITGTVIASISINIGMWLERFLIVVPTLSRPRLPYGHGIYHPTWVEISIFAGEVAALCLLYVLFVKFFPIISIWELRETEEKEIVKSKETADALSD